MSPRIPEPMLVVPELEAWLADEVGLITRQDVRAKARRLASYLNMAYFGAAPHRNPVIGRWARHRPTLDWVLHASSFRGPALRKAFGEDYKRLLRRFFDFPEANEGYSSGIGRENRQARQQRLTKAYLLTSATVEALDTIWRTDAPAIVRDKHTGKRLTAKQFPPNGVLATGYGSLHVPGLLAIDATRLTDTVDEVERQTPTNVVLRAEHLRVLRELFHARKWVNTIGGIPNLYTDRPADGDTDGSGRLNGIGPLHIQGMSRRARSYVLQGTGWRDYDFRKCHPTIFVALADAYSVRPALLSDYLVNPDSWGSALASRLDIHEGKVKQLMNSLLYGLPITTWPKSALVRLVGQANAARLEDDAEFRVLLSGIATASKEIVCRHQHGEFIENVVGKRTNIKSPVNRSNRTAKLLSHVLNGYEVWALNVACGGANDIKALIHDGFVSASQKDEAMIEARIAEQSYQQFGFTIPLRLNEKQVF